MKTLVEVAALLLLAALLVMAVLLSFTIGVDEIFLHRLNYLEKAYAGCWTMMFYILAISFYFAFFVEEINRKDVMLALVPIMLMAGYTFICVSFALEGV